MYPTVHRCGEASTRVADMHASERAIRTINNAGYRDHAKALFIKSNTPKFMDLVKFKTAQIMFKAKNNLLPVKIHGVYTDREIVV